MIAYNVVLRNIQFVTISYDRTSKDEAERQNQENISKVIETYGMRPQTFPMGAVFQMKHGRIACKVEQESYGRYGAVICYTNNPNNDGYLENSYSEF